MVGGNDVRYTLESSAYWLMLESIEQMHIDCAYMQAFVDLAIDALPLPPEIVGNQFRR